MRRKDREISNPGEIRKIIEEAKILHLALFDGEHPYIVPLHYGYADHNGLPVFYMHGAPEGHKLDLIRANPHVCVELECRVQLIEAGENPCGYGSAYASVIGRGKAEIVTDPDEKREGLRLLMQHQTGREFAIHDFMASSVAVLRVPLDEISAKSRPLPPSDT